MNSKLFSDLEKLNFSINESKVYLMLLRLGPSLAGTIAKETHLDRSSTYNALKTLVEKGIVSTVHETKRTTFVPAPPTKILDYLQEKEEIAKNIIPDLEKRFSSIKNKSSIQLFQGYKGIKTIFNDMLATAKEVYVMGSEGQLKEHMPYFTPILKMKKNEKKIKTKILIREKRIKKTRGRFTDYRAVPSDVISEATVNIYGDKVAIFIWEDNPKAILIKNDSVKRTFENYFRFMWKNAKKLNLHIKKP